MNLLRQVPLFANLKDEDKVCIEETEEWRLPAGEMLALRLKIQTLLEDAEQSTGRIASLVEAVRSIARQERAELADIDVHEQIRSALGVLDHKLRNLQVTQNFSSECGHVRGYPSELAQVWVNLLDNAADAVNGGGEIAIQTRRDDNQTVVEILDNGPGIPPQNLTHIFEPFFTTKGVGSGKGLGLTISQGIVGDRHGGEIEVESKAGETRFIVRLPVRQIERNEGTEAIVANSRVYGGTDGAGRGNEICSSASNVHRFCGRVRDSFRRSTFHSAQRVSARVSFDGN